MPLYYGRNATNRYDDPARHYGVLYMGFDLATALMESVFHKHRWLSETKRVISLKEVQNRIVRIIGVTRALRLADLTAPGVMASVLGLNLEQLAGRDYTYTQQISAWVYNTLRGDDHPLFDGILYPSRNNYPAESIALFERSKSKIRLIEDINLVDHVDWPPFVAHYRVAIGPEPGPGEPENEVV